MKKLKQGFVTKIIILLSIFFYIDKARICKKMVIRLLLLVTQTKMIIQQYRRTLSWNLNDFTFKTKIFPFDKMN